MARGPRISRLELAATILRRAAGAGTGGKARGDWQEVFYPRVKFQPLQGAEQVQGGTAMDRMLADVSLRDGEQARLITAADRIRIGTTDYTIDSVTPADRAYRYIRLRVSLRFGG